MTDTTSRKVAATHLSRKAFLYIRQSTLRQVAENQESTRRQYGLRERALALGWSAEQIVVLDCDLGVSGASADREGFRKLVAEVGMGHAGIVLGLEVSRLARNSTDWHRLLEICALLTNTLEGEMWRFIYKMLFSALGRSGEGLPRTWHDRWRMPLNGHFRFVPVDPSVPHSTAHFTWLLLGSKSDVLRRGVTIEEDAVLQ